MEAITKIENEISTRIDIEMENLHQQDTLIEKLEPSLVCEHVMSNLKEHFSFHMRLMDTHGNVEIFNEDKESEGGLINRFAIVFYAIDFTYNAPALYEIIRQTSTSDIELAKDRISVFVPLPEEIVDQIDLNLAFQTATSFIQRANELALAVPDLIDSYRPMILAKISPAAPTEEFFGSPVDPLL